MGAVRRSYSRGVVLVQAGSPSHNVGIILSGRIEAVRLAPNGSPLPITQMGPRRRLWGRAGRFQPVQPCDRHRLAPPAK